MSTLDKSYQTVVEKIFYTYIGVTVFCALFSAVYEYFSHGVYSWYMICLALIPLIGGMIPFGIFTYANETILPKRMDVNLFNSGIATLTVGSAIMGILEIYGTSSNLTFIYAVAGGIFATAGIISYIIHRFTGKVIESNEQ